MHAPCCSMAAPSPPMALCIVCSAAVKCCRISRERRGPVRVLLQHIQCRHLLLLLLLLGCCETMDESAHGIKRHSSSSSSSNSSTAFRCCRERRQAHAALLLYPRARTKGEALGAPGASIEQPEAW